MSEFRFADPNWIHAIWIVVLLAIGLIVLEARGNSLLDRFISPWMQSRLLSRIPLSRRIASVLFFATALTMIILGLMRPQWGQTVQTTTTVESQVMICLDLSKSMLAEDVVPNRLERAKAEINSLLSLMDQGQQVGLIGFAGRATVLCPMTTDFGFLRLVLGEATPASVGLGGTKIGEAVRKAASGFRSTGDINRLILLITDGEDHDSFPLDAAQEAMEKGVKIVAVGFGDETGSKIEITNPSTGTRSFLKDRNGNEVVSALDGETLRELALKTEGVYIPAGTGALDWQSIYEAHIESLMDGAQGEEERIIRNEGYQWCVMLALASLFLSVLLRSRGLARSQSSTSVFTKLVSTTAILVMGTLPNYTFALPVQLPSELNKQDSASASNSTTSSSPQPDPDENSNVATSKESVESSADSASMRELEQPPRTLYNMGIRVIESNPDRAEKLLTEARNQAGVDGELRFRALFNLSWVDVVRSDRRIEAEPEQALRHLELAASRLREAIRLRPESMEARQNLEVLTQRILELRDRIASQQEETLETQLDALLAAMRGHQQELQEASGLQQAKQSMQSDSERALFRKLGVPQRRILSDLQKLNTEALREMELQKSELEDASSSEAAIRMRLAQLSSATKFLDQALQKTSRARSATRRAQVDRAFLRWSSALAEVKRARDQFRNPIDVLSVLQQDATQLAQSTVSLAQYQGQAASAVQAPAWLTQEYLLDEQTLLHSRLSQLNSRLEPAANTPPEAEVVDEDQTKMQDDIRNALPHLKNAASEFEKAIEKIQASSLDPASSHQQSAIEELQLASEFFYDLRRLIEVMYRDQNAIMQAIEATQTLTAVEQPHLLVQTLSDMESRNEKRCPRLKDLIEAEKEGLAEEPNEGRAATSPNPPQQDLEEQKQKFEIAAQLQQALAVRLAAAKQRLKELSANPPELPEERPPSPETTFHPDQARFHLLVEQLPLETAKESEQILEELRRLFFTLVEHLRETAQRQAELNDETLASLPSTSPTHDELPMQSKAQKQLADLARVIGEELHKQGEALSNEGKQLPENTNGTQGEPSAQQLAENARVLDEAAQLVSQAAKRLESAANSLESLSTKPLANEDSVAVTGSPQPVPDQKEGLEKLVEALALLDDRQSGDDGQNQQDQQEDQAEQPQNDQQQGQDSQNMSSSQMLQAIRDREAKRRREKSRQAVLSGGGVEKDW